MPDRIKAGTILIKRDALLPEALRFESEPCAFGWSFVKNLDGYGLDRQIRKTGWTFFYLAGRIETVVFGFDGEKALRKAVERILAKVKSEQCNSLEITKVTSKHFLGLRYTRVTAHSRHIQESLFLFRADTRPEWGLLARRKELHEDLYPQEMVAQPSVGGVSNG